MKSPEFESYKSLLRASELLRQAGHVDSARVCESLAEEICAKHGLAKSARHRAGYNPNRAWSEYWFDHLPIAELREICDSADAYLAQHGGRWPLQRIESSRYRRAKEALDRRAKRGGGAA